MYRLFLSIARTELMFCHINYMLYYVCNIILHVMVGYIICDVQSLIASKLLPSPLSMLLSNSPLSTALTIIIV